MFVGTKIEGVLCLVLLALWIMDCYRFYNNGSSAWSQCTRRSDKFRTECKFILFQLGWVLITCVAIMIDYCRAAYGINARDALRNRAPRLELWSGMIGTATVVMGSSSRPWLTIVIMTIAEVFLCSTVLEHVLA
jgi:hypothetical protein